MTKVKVKISLDLFLSKAKRTNFFEAYKKFFSFKLSPFFPNFFHTHVFYGYCKDGRHFVFYWAFSLSQKLRRQYLQIVDTYVSMNGILKEGIQRL